MSEESNTLQATCGCCAGLKPQTPMVVANRGGLSAIAYRVGTHEQFRSSMISGLSSRQHPALGKLLTREPDDFAIALVDAFACMADVLTFYQERIANESYLRTATERRSLQEMARLVGYRLRPGVAAETYLAFTIEDAPGAFGQTVSTSTVPNTNKEIPPVIPITIEIGTKVQSTPGPGEQAQTFETVEKIEARAEWNAIKPRLTQLQDLKVDMRNIILKGTENNLKIGDSVLIRIDRNNQQVKRISNVSPDNETKTTRIDFEEDESVFLFPRKSNRPSFRKGELRAFSTKAPLDDDIVRAILDKTWRKENLSALVKMQGWSIEELITHVENQKPLQTQSKDSGVFVFRQRANIFGFNAPNQPTCDGEKLNEVAQWIKWTPSEPKETNKIFLDNAYDAVLRGSYIAVQKPSDSPKIYHVVKVVIRPRTAYGMSAKTTEITLEKDWWDHNTDDFDTIRGTSVLAQSVKLELAEVPIEDLVGNDTITLDRIYLDLKAGQTVILTGERNDLKGIIASEIMWLKEVIVEAGFTVLTFDKSLAHKYVPSTVTINANVARGTHGETVHEVLGSGDASRAFQSFELKQPPVTYVSAENSTGADSTIKMRVNDIQWHEVPTLYGRHAQERVFTTKATEDGKTILTCGDGVNGERLPSGQENVQAVYRKGIGAEGNVAANTLTQLMTRPLGLKAVTNPKKASGGTNPESPHEARRNIPVGIRTLGRAVSLLDYEDFARTFAGIAKAHAAVLNLSAGRTIFLTVAGEHGAFFEAKDKVLKNLSEALRKSGDPLVHVEVGPYRPASFGLILNVKHDPDHLWKKVSSAVKTALHTTFSFEEREFGQPVPRSEVIAVVQRTPGVVAVNIDMFYRTVPCAVYTPTDRLPADLETVDSLGRPVGAEILTLSGDLLDVQEMP